MFKVSKNKIHKKHSFNVLFLVSLLVSVLVFTQNGQAAKTKKNPDQRIEKCNNLTKELKALKSEQAVKNMAKGFEWVKANMEGEALLPIKQYLEVSEKIKFQCPQAKRKKNTVKKKSNAKNPKSVNIKHRNPPPPKRKKTSNPPKKIKKNKPKNNKNTKVESVSSGDLTSLLEDFFSGPQQTTNKNKP